VEETEKDSSSHSPPASCHPLMNNSHSIFQNLATGLGRGAGTEPCPLTMLRRLGWGDAAEIAASSANDISKSIGDNGESPFSLTGTLAATAERLQADYLQYCLAKESARLFYSRLVALQQPHPLHPRYVQNHRLWKLRYITGDGHFLAYSQHDGIFGSA
jgi:hypothetical protein